MDITVQSVLQAIDVINNRKTLNLVFKPPKGDAANLPIGLDSIAFQMNVKQEDLAHVIAEMIAFDILELVHQKLRRDGSKGIKQVKLKE